MPFSADAVAVQQVQERLKSLQSMVQDIEAKRQVCEQTVNALQKSNTDDKGNAQRVKGLIKSVVTTTDAEQEAIRQALQAIYEIRNIKNERRIQARNLAADKESIRRGTWMKMLLSSAQTLPLFVGDIGEEAPPLCGAVPATKNYVAKIGDMVAALANVTDTEGEDWILAEVVSYDHSTKKYEVDDILKEQNQEDHYTLNKRRVIPLTLMRANPETNPEALFPQGTLVMALFPQTTCFYKALISRPPATHTDEYEVLFEDDTYSEGYSPPTHVPQRYVIQYKPRKQKEAAGTSQVPSDSESDSDDQYEEGSNA